jgi:hypothetical protein
MARTSRPEHREAKTAHSGSGPALNLLASRPRLGAHDQ